MIHLGFTGTRRGMTDAQRRSVDMLIAEAVATGVGVIAHHGDCWGADAEFHSRAVIRRCKTVGHPSTHNLRAYCQFDVEHERKAPLDRNLDIVKAATFMIAAPFETDEQQRGGTWATIRMARREGTPLAIVKPNGEVVRERWPQSETRVTATLEEMIDGE